MMPVVKNRDDSPVLVCLDGSPDSRAAAELALLYAHSHGKPVIAAHVYDARIHETRFRQMEPGLPEQYQAEEGLKNLRDSHTILMTDGFETLSRGYLREFISQAENMGVAVRVEVARGRNYLELRRIARDNKPALASLGASGLGSLGDGMMGSTAARLLRCLECDVLLGRSTAPPRGPVLAGIDGSDHARTSMDRASDFAGIMDAPLHLLAAYDPALHQRVFAAMADTMPAEAQKAVGLEKQKDLHESIIDDGLGALYREFLEEAAGSLGERDVEKHLESDKAYRALVGKAGSISARLVCVGRYGHNREDGLDIGATAEAVARLAACHVLVSAQAGVQEGNDNGIPWEPEASERLRKVPRFVRRMARRSIEAAAREAGADRVTVEHVEKAARRFRPGREGPDD